MPAAPAGETVLVGGVQRDPAPGDHSLIGGLFDTLPARLGLEPGITRWVGYEGVGAAGDRVRFFGLELSRARPIPDGLQEWRLTDARWTIREARPGGPAALFDNPIVWRWLDHGRAVTGRRTGEFESAGPAAWRPARARGRRVWEMFANAYQDLGGDPAPDEVCLVDYDPAWPARFAEMAAWLLAGLGPATALSIEHYGSTAIPGMPAKPVVDLLVEVPSMEEGRRRAIPLLNAPDWEYWFYADHLCFIKRDGLNGVRTHHVHLAPRAHPVWQGIAFRDHLRAHPEDAARYADLKRSLAGAFRDDREGYTQAKTDFVREIALRAGGRNAPRSGAR
jgi:GrpB-like predicted nucleotidyltransferase (UPF0157 family)